MGTAPVLYPCASREGKKPSVCVVLPLLPRQREQGPADEGVPRGPGFRLHPGGRGSPAGGRSCGVRSLMALQRWVPCYVNV